MASNTVYTCDKCKSEGRLPLNGIEIRNIGDWIHSSRYCYYDLCGKCLASLKEWLK